MDPIEGNDGLNPLQNRVSVDNQTDINSVTSSLYPSFQYMAALKSYKCH